MLNLSCPSERGWHKTIGAFFYVSSNAACIRRSAFVPVAATSFQAFGLRTEGAAMRRDDSRSALPRQHGAPRIQNGKNHQIV
jgi:hypothetical protein